MPETLAQWLWFTFFTGGSLGGWFLLALLANDTVKGWRRKR